MKQLVVRVIGGRQFLHGYNPYVKFLWRGEKYKTSPAGSTTDPKWGDQFILDYDDKVGSGDLSFSFLIWHDKFGKNTQLGRADVNIGALNLITNAEFSRQETKIQEGPGYLEYEIKVVDSTIAPAVATAPPYSAPSAYPPQGYPLAQPTVGYGQPQYPAQQYPPQQYPAQQYPPQQYPAQQYPPQQYPAQPYPPQQYPTPSQQYPGQPQPYYPPPPQPYPPPQYPPGRGL